MTDDDLVHVDVGAETLEASLVVPASATGLVLFAHGAGSSRHSPRNREVAARLRASGLATMLLDLLTAEEDEVDRATRALRFDIGLLADRLDAARRWLRTERDLDLPLGFFGASTGAAAALVAAAAAPADVAAVVSRGGRPDLAGDALPRVSAPTLLIVGSADRQVLELNLRARDAMVCTVEIEVVPGATHLFAEPGALEAVGDLAAAWLRRHLAAA